MPTFRFAMGSDRCTRTTLVARCCYGAFFGFGFVLTVITLAIMFWIAWFYFGLTIVQFSDTQRRAVVNYSYSSTSKPFSSTTILPTRSTTLSPEETSINSIPKSTVAGSVLRGSSSRGESQVKFNKRKEKENAAVISSLAKGDFAAREWATHDSNATAFHPEDVSSVVPAARGPSRNKENISVVSKEKASIATVSSVEDSEEDRVYTRRVFPPGAENRPEEKNEPLDRNVRRNPAESETIPRLDIAPTKVYEPDKTSESSRIESVPDKPPRDDVRPPPRDYIVRDRSELPRRDDIQSSRRLDPEPVYREPDFDRDYPRRYATERGRSRYDDIDDMDERGSRGRYDKRDRGRDSDDRYPKGDTRVYPDEVPEDRYRARERYPDDVPMRRGDDDRYEDDRYRDYDERARNRDRETRYRDRDLNDKPPLKDDDRYRPRDDDRYRNRDEDRYRPRDDEYRSRDDDRYRSRDDVKVRPRDDDRYVYRDDDRYRSRGDDDRYRTRDDDRYAEDRRDTAPLRPRDERDEYNRPKVVIDDDKYSPTSRVRDTDYRESASRSSSSLAVDRKPITSSRSEYDARKDGTVTDYDNPVRDRPRPYVRDDVNPSRLSRPSYDDVRDRDREDNYRKPSRYEDEVREIAPTKTRDDSKHYSRTSLIDSRSRDISGSRYIDSERDRIRDDSYYEQDDRIRSTKAQDTRGSESFRRVPEDDEKYRTRLPYEDSKSSDGREEVVLDRRSYASEEDEEYKRRGPARTDEVYDDRNRDRRPVDDSRRRYRDDEDYPPRRRDPVDDEYKRSRTRDDYDKERIRSRERYDDEYRRYDDDRYSSKGDKSPPVRRYDAYPDEDERPSRQRDSEIRKDDARSRDENLRSSSSSRDEERLRSRDEYPDLKSSSSRRRYGDDDLSLSDTRDLRDDYSDDDRRYLRGPRKPPVSAKDYTLGSSRTSLAGPREPDDVVIREKRYQSSSNAHQSSRVYSDEVAGNERSYTNAESTSKEQVRPLSAKDVIEAAIRHSDGSDQNLRKVYYPVFDPRVSNLTSPEIIRPSERRGTTITAKKRRSVSLRLVKV